MARMHNTIPDASPAEREAWYSAALLGAGFLDKAIRPTDGLLYFSTTRTVWCCPAPRRQAEYNCLGLYPQVQRQQPFLYFKTLALDVCLAVPFATIYVA